MARIHTLEHPTRADQWRITVKFKNKPIGVFDKKDGGEVDSDDTKYYPGGMDPPISLGGRKTTGNVTLQRIYSEADHALVNDLMHEVGRAALWVDQTPLDRDGKGYGNPIVYEGILKRVTIPPHDSESGAAAMLELEATINGIPHVG